MTTNYKLANCVKGHILSGGDGTIFFRVYSETDTTFKDYKLWHCDLHVQILDPDAFFYEEETKRKGEVRFILDHSPETLGRL